MRAVHIKGTRRYVKTGSVATIGKRESSSISGRSCQQVIKSPWFFLQRDATFLRLRKGFFYHDRNLFLNSGRLEPVQLFLVTVR